MQKKIIIANWKCNPISTKEGEKILFSLKESIKTENEVIICPPSVFLSHFLTLFSGIYSFGGQDCFFEEKGAYTGEISPKMLQSIGCKYVIVGHSERRTIFNETDKTINLKINRILNSTKLIPILCIGENREEREKNKTFAILKEQIKNALKGVAIGKAKKIIIAYEPIWAIGTGVYAEEKQIEEAKDYIAKILCDIYGSKTSKIIYGGSVDSKNIKQILGTTDMDGVLVGGSSLKPKEFSAIANYK
ncbi:MAG: triose-phosphate isomerase [Candidatus Paceibacterota bacterium]|jgi:triosephosphate isomerase|nr:triose-phosphate isomerase [bacterium]